MENPYKTAPMGLADAEVMLKRAQEEFTLADDSYRQASSVRTGALNRLNNAQRAFDTAVAVVKSKPPSESDWKRDADRRKNYSAEHQ